MNKNILITQMEIKLLIFISCVKEVCLNFKIVKCFIFLLTRELNEAMRFIDFKIVKCFILLLTRELNEAMRFIDFEIYLYQLL